MASRSAPPINSPRTVGYDDFVDQRIQKTRSAVKSADLVTGLVTLLAWALGLLLLAAAADHWLVAGGFDRWGRFALFAIGLVGGLLYIGTRLGPALIGRVNPLYAAQQIESESPQLKNSLLNLLQLRGNRAGGPAAVQRTLERQAAEGLAAVGETTIDRSGLVRSARIVLALVAAIGIYVVASPKDFFASAGRVLAPWADIAVPSRVQISMLEPGEVELAQGERIEVSALVAGLRESELVELVFSTKDGRLVERRVPMIPRREKSLQYTVSLPAGGGSAAALGLQGDLTYRLEAGDARTRNYEVTVLTAPTISPVSVTYQYPAYTGFTKQVVEGVGDLRALEGTRVTIAAQANLPIDSAQIDLGADGRPDTRMKVDGERATGTFVLRRDPNTAGDSATSYVLRFTSKDNQANNNPPQYRVEVLADLAPEASILVPAETTIDVTLNQRVRLEIEARDPDFALRGVRLVGEAGGKRVLDERLLTKAFQGKFTSEQVIVPRDLGLQPGAVLEYWVEAIDNKTPQPNRGESEHKQLRVVGPADNAAGDPDQGEQQPGQGQRQPGEGSDDAETGNQGQPGSNGAQQSKQPSGGSEQNPGEPSNQGGEQEQQGKQNENPEDQENQDGKSRKPSPDGLRAPGGGGGEGNDEEAESSSSSGGEEGGESDSQSNSPQGSGSESGSDGQDPPGNQGSLPGESGESSGNRDQQGNQQGNQNGEEGQQGTDSQSDGDNQDGAGESEAPVPRNGEDDATAFERIREFLKNQQDSGGGREKDRRRQPGEPNSQSDSETDPGQSGNQNQPGRQGDPSERPDGDGERSESDPSDAREGSPNEQGENGQGTPQEGSPNSKQQSRDGEAGEQPDRPEEGAGPGEQDRSGQQSDSANSESGGETPPGESTDPQAGPREGTGSSGQNQAADQGAGQSSDQGAGDSTDRPGSQQQSDQPTGESGGEQAGEGSQSSDGGDKPGGNEQPGDTGGEGSGAGGDESGAESRNNQTVDESGQQGSSDAGDTGGQPGDSAGEQGSGQQNSGDAANGESGQSASDGAKPGDSQQGEQPNDKASGEQGKGKSGEATGPPTGKRSQSGTTDTPGDGTEPGGDAANLDYAREQTELVLEELEEQLTKREVDRKLLEKLGWDEQDLRRFVERWQSRKQQATQRGPAGEAELDQALRNLGLSPGKTKATRKISKDQLRDLRERARQAIPPRLRQATDAYNRSLNALDDDSAASGKD